MQQRDIIKDEIERLGRVLGKVITMLAGMDGGELEPNTRHLIGNQLRRELDLSLEELLILPPDDLKAKFEQLRLQPAHLDQLGDLLDTFARGEEDPDEQRTNLHRALLLYDLAGEASGIYSMERADKEAAIRAKLG